MVKAYLAMAVGSSLLAQVARPVLHLTGMGGFLLGMGIYMSGLGIIYAIEGSRS